LSKLLYVAGGQKVAQKFGQPLLFKKTALSKYHHWAMGEKSPNLVTLTAAPVHRRHFIEREIQTCTGRLLFDDVSKNSISECISDV
jgi:hypothetical protein